MCTAFYTSHISLIEHNLKATSSIGGGVTQQITEQLLFGLRRAKRSLKA